MNFDKFERLFKMIKDILKLKGEEKYTGRVVITVDMNQGGISDVGIQEKKSIKI